MALSTKKNITLTGESRIKGQQVIYLSANITTDNIESSNVTQSISDQSFYEENRAECRKDINTFQEQIWKIEDEMMKEVISK